MIRLRLLVQLLVLVALVWGATAVFGTRGAAGDPLASHDPCLQPLTWRVGDVDPRFGMSDEAVAEAARAAVRVWEEPTGLTLFRYDPQGDMPIHLVYDERQEDFLGDEGRRAELARMESNVAGEQRRYESQLRSYEEAAAALRGLAQSVEERVRAYNAVVAEWNRRGGAPAEEAARLRAESEAIAREQAGLREREQAVEGLRQQLEAEGRRLERTAAQFNSRVEELRAESPGRMVNSANFGFETVSRGRWVTDVRRWINVFQFSTPEHLVFLLAHELGHAMGLDHVPDAGAIMREEHTTDQLSGVVSLHPADHALLMAQCGGRPGV